jgi:hypothetical protein
MGRECPSVCLSVRPHVTALILLKRFYQTWHVRPTVRTAKWAPFWCDVWHCIAQNAWPSFAMSVMQPTKTTEQRGTPFAAMTATSVFWWFQFLLQLFSKGLPDFQFRSIGLTICGGDELIHLPTLCPYTLTGSTSLIPNRASGKDPKMVSFNTHPYDLFPYDQF